MVHTPGIHHITAMCGSAQTNVSFYRGLLGLRLVKVTVNYDDPGTYHLYYGDGLGRPGTILTFFPWAGVRRGITGVGQVGVTAFAVPLGSLDYWQARLEANGVAIMRDRRFDEEFLAFADHDGMLLELVATTSEGPGEAWAGSDVPVEFAIRGFHHAELWVRDIQPSLDFLTGAFSMIEGETDINRTRVVLGEGGSSRIVDLVAMPERHAGLTGAGSVHHIAFRVATDADHPEWRAQVSAHGARPTPVTDRTYFQSIYFREPGGVLFEMATDAPGFTWNEPESELGTHLMLPEWLEPDRDTLRHRLPTIDLGEGVLLP